MILPYLLTGFVTLAALLLYFAICFRVGYLRGKLRIDPPAIDGPVVFLRARGVHANTLEQLVLFLPALWLFALTMGDRIAALLGLVWIIARIGYALVYYRDPTKRIPLFMIGVLATLALLLGSLIGLLLVARVAWA